MNKLLTAGLLVAAAGGAVLAAQAAQHSGSTFSSARRGPGATNHVPVLTELYQSQGCSSCPPANANLNAIADRPDVVALSFGVTYWDQLGWKDSFAKPQYTDRQWEYARFNHLGNVATPQVWVNGSQTIVGSNANELNAVIAHAATKGPQLSLAGNEVRIGAGPSPSAGTSVWLARYEPRVVQVAIRAGENGGRTLPHKNIVRSLVQIGRWSGSAENIALPRATDNLASAVFLQAGMGGPVLAVTKG
jgi:hypothetical protein